MTNFTTKTSKLAPAKRQNFHQKVETSEAVFNVKIQRYENLICLDRVTPSRLLFCAFFQPKVYYTRDGEIPQQNV